jgi:glycosyltransferase involved in cell wall biosynthesis
MPEQSATGSDMSPGQTASSVKQLVNGAHDVASVILAHDYLIQMGGAERLFASLHRAWPGAPVYVSATDYDHLMPDFKGAEIRNTWMQRLPGLRKHHKKMFPVFPFAFKSFGRLDADAAVVSSSGFSKWLRFTPRTRVFCYCHTPPRFFWQTEHYLRNEVQSEVLKAFARLFVMWLRPSDYACAKRVHHFIANSNNVKNRIREFYGRDSVVIYPPVDVHKFRVTSHHEGYYLILSRLVSYKGIDRAVVAFLKNGRRLVIAGGGPDRARLEQLADGAANIEFGGRVEDDEAIKLIENCRAFVLPGSEDFGITPLEAQAAGKPVLAFGDGGALETVVDGETGVLFTDPSPDSINASIARLESVLWNPDRIRRHAERFAEPNFIAAMQNYVREQLAVPAPQLP